MRSQQFIIVDGTVCKGAVTDKYKQVDKEQYSANTLFRLIFLVGGVGELREVHPCSLASPLKLLHLASYDRI